MTQSTTTTLEIRPRAGCIGADVTGIDLRTPLTDGQLGEIRHLLDEHLVLFFPGQQLDDELPGPLLVVSG